MARESLDKNLRFITTPSYSTEQLKRPTPDILLVFDGQSVFPTSTMAGLRCGPTRAESSRPIRHGKSFEFVSCIICRVVSNSMQGRLKQHGEFSTRQLHRLPGIP